MTIAQRLRNFWAIVRRPSVHYSLGFLTLGGFIGGIVFWGAFNTAMEITNTEKFCTGCHEMRDNVFAELKTTIHYTNRSGVRAICSNCHVPHDWTDKMARKMQASKEVWAKVFGTVGTQEKFRDKRLELAQHEWARFKANDSLECRNCHNYEYMDFTRQSARAQTMHSTYLASKEKTCIDCHKGIAHRLPHIPPGQAPTDSPGQIVPKPGDEALARLKVQRRVPDPVARKQVAEILRNGLSVRDLGCVRAGRRVFSGVSFDVAPGDVLQVRGANGSGKSSLLRLMCGLLQPAAGEVRWCERDIAGSDAGFAGDMAYMGHADGMSGELSVLENLRYSLRVAGRVDADGECHDVLERLHLAGRAHAHVRHLSQGQRRRLSLARVVLSRRKLWLLDEPCAGLDTEGEQRFDAYLAAHLDGGGLAVVTIHRDIARDGPCAYTLQLDASSHGDPDPGHRA